MPPLSQFLHVAEDLDIAGLTWLPEIGDEIADRKAKDSISILVDPGGMTPAELRSTYLWLPSVEQLVLQFEARQAILFHAGLEYTEQAYCYKTVLRTQIGAIEATADSLRLAMGMALRELLLGDNSEVVN